MATLASSEEDAAVASDASGITVAGGVLPCALLVAPQAAVITQPGSMASVALKWIPITINPALTSWFVHNIYAQVCC